MTTNTTTATINALYDALTSDYRIASTAAITKQTRQTLRVESVHTETLTRVSELAGKFDLLVTQSASGVLDIRRRPAPKRPRRTNGFRRGSSTFRCRCCKRLTRETGVQSMGIELCPQCYEIAGIDNSINDGNSTMADNATELRALVNEVAEAGGSLGFWTALIDALNAYELTDARRVEPVAEVVVDVEPETETRVWIVRQAPAGNWVQDMSASDWQTPEDALATLDGQRRIRPRETFAIATVTTTIVIK